MFTIRDALPADCEAIAEMVRGLARDTGAAKVPEVTGETLRAHAFGRRALLILTVAEDERGLAGCCVAAKTFSTWRGAQGLYIIDLYVAPHARNVGLGERLLHTVARQGWKAGARFIRMEVAKNNAGAERFYERFGFHENRDDAMWALEESSMKVLAGFG
jgi:ribosomal protein S18 acetylase RimI-like enzyme